MFESYRNVSQRNNPKKLIFISSFENVSVKVCATLNANRTRALVGIKYARRKFTKINAYHALAYISSRAMRCGHNNVGNLY